MVHAGLGYLAAADATEMAAEAQAECLRGLERADAVATAARASILAAFTAGRGYAADADYSPRAWLIHKTNITRGAAAGHTAWARRAAGHSEVVKVLAAGDISESVARTICTWTDRLPSDCRDATDAILVAAVVGGLGLRDMAALAAELLDRYQPSDPDPDRDEDFDDRAVHLETTFGGAGVLRGDLTPECAAALGAVLDALSAPKGAEDTRSRAQRYHDALQEAAQRLLAAGLLPERAGQPVKAWVHVSLADLMTLEGSSALQEEWIARVRAGWAARRAAASVGGSDGGAWLDGDAARAAACDASTAPVVWGEVNFAALDGLVRLCVELARLEQTDPVGPPPAPASSGAPAGGQAAADNATHCPAGTAGSDPASSSGGPAARASASGAGASVQDPAVPASDAAASASDSAAVSDAAAGDLRRREALQQAIIGKAVELLSGPGGLASFLRRRQLGARLGGPSLPLDVGVSRDIPAAIRAAVILRDQHCRFPGGCDQPAAACEIHHIIPQTRGGRTSVQDCGLFCFFHHHVVIHDWGWTVVLNPDGTTTAWSPDKTKILHSHGPPPKAG